METSPLLRLPNELLEALSWSVRLEDLQQYVRVCRRVFTNSQRRIRQHQRYLHKYRRVLLDCLTEHHGAICEKDRLLIAKREEIVADAHDAVRDPTKSRYVRQLTVICYRPRDEQARAELSHNTSNELWHREGRIDFSDIDDLASAIRSFPSVSIGHKALHELRRGISTYTHNTAPWRQPWEIWACSDGIIRYVSWLLCPNLTALHIRGLQPGSGLARVLSEAVALNASNRQSLLTHLRCFNIQIIGQRAGDLFEDLLPVANITSLRYLRAEIDRTTQQAQNFTQDTGGAPLKMRAVPREDLRLWNLQRLELYGDAPEASSFRRLLSGLRALRILHFTTKSNIDPQRYLRALPSTNTSLRKLSLLSSAGAQGEINSSLRKIGPFSNFCQLEKLEVQALWLLPSLGNVLPASLKYLGLALPSRMDLVHACSPLFEGLAESIEQKLPNLTCILFSEHSKTLIDPLQEQLTIVGSKTEIEVGPLKHSIST